LKDVDMQKRTESLSDPARVFVEFKLNKRLIKFRKAVRLHKYFPHSSPGPHTVRIPTI